MRNVKRMIFPAWSKAGYKISLSDVLELVPENNLTWSVIGFEGVGKAPMNLGMSEFSAITDESVGFIMSWSEVREFSLGLEDVHEGVFLAVERLEDLNAGEVQSGKFREYIFRLENLDSSEWEIRFSSEFVGEAEMAQGVANLFSR